MRKIVGYLYQVEAFFQDSATHVLLMDNKKITVQRDLSQGGFVIEAEG